MMENLSVMPVRHDWNAVGPRVPAWFRQRLARIDPTLGLQFIPPNDHPVSEGKGLDPGKCPKGGWQIVRKLRNGWLHKLAVFSLTDRYGRPVPPNEETCKILDFAKRMWNNQEFEKLMDLQEEAIQEMQHAKATKSKDELQSAIQKFMSLQGNRQFENRVFTGTPISEKGNANVFSG